MLWVTRRRIQVNRVGTAWLIRRFIDPEARFRFVEPEEVASLVVWLASTEAAMVTGASYTMDGGWSAR